MKYVSHILPFLIILYSTTAKALECYFPEIDDSEVSWNNEVTVPKEVLETDRGVIYTYYTENINSIERIETGKYLNAKLEGHDLIFYLTEKFENFEEETSSYKLKITLTFDCTVDVYDNYLTFIFNVKDDNNHQPVFSQDAYEYKFSMEIPKGFDLTQFVSINATDHDFTTNTLYFAISDNDDFTLARVDKKDSKINYASLKSRQIIRAPYSRQLTLSVSDGGNPQFLTTAPLTITVSPNILTTLEFTQNVYYGNYKKNKLVKMEEPIKIKKGCDHTTIIRQFNYTEYFKVSYMNSTEELLVQNIKPLPKTITLQEIVPLTIEAETPGITYPRMTTVIIRTENDVNGECNVEILGHSYDSIGVVVGISCLEFICVHIMKLTLFLVHFLVILNFSAGDSYCEIEGVSYIDWMFHETDIPNKIPETERGVIYSYNTLNIIAIKNIKNGRYISAELKENNLTFYTTENFENFENEAKYYTIEVEVEFECVENSLDYMSFVFDIKDINTHQPSFNKKSFEYNFLMNIPEGLILTEFAAITATDKDFTNDYLSFAISDNDDFTISRIKVTDKVNFARLKSLRNIEAPYSRKFTLYVSDGSVTDFVTAATLTVTISTNVLTSLQFSESVYYGNYMVRNIVELEEPINIITGQDNTTKIWVQNYADYFTASWNIYRKEYEIRNIKPLPKRIILQGFVPLTIEAETPGVTYSLGCSCTDLLSGGARNKNTQLVVIADISPTFVWVLQCYLEIVRTEVSTAGLKQKRLLGLDRVKVIVCANVLPPTVMGFIEAENLRQTKESPR
ncbi:hypothetical protein FQR65_LT07264 [Abscondita terminalis]|nr:hypothetical protein FQR65_LT07264 [Abscondita terminalis]